MKQEKTSWMLSALLLGAFLAQGALVAQGQTYKLLYSFHKTDGEDPKAALILDASGNLYGTTYLGGASGSGTVFKLDPAGNETVLHSFNGPVEGASPLGGLVLDAAGNLYGTTFVYGTLGYGTVFKVNKNGNLKVLHNFSGSPDGRNPVGDLVMDSSGNLFGITSGGGAAGDSGCSDATSNGCGAVFELSKDGNEVILHSFTGPPDGTSPTGGLVRDASGNFYGTTYVGGSADTCCGIVFKLDSTGNETVLYRFSGAPDASFPEARLVRGPKGNLFGVGADFGDVNLYGTIFEISTAGNETVLYSFSGTSHGGEYPLSVLATDPAGNLYGTTSMGGTGGCGTVFKLSKNGTETVLHSFTTATGCFPYAGLIRDSAGNLYGTTESGGASNYGTVFEITP